MTARASGRTLARAGLIVTAAFLASRILGWIRLAIIGTTFGAGAELDSFYAAFRIPDFIFQLVAAGALGRIVLAQAQWAFGVRGREGAGHPSLDPVEAGREPQRFFRGGSLPSQKLCPRRPALEFRNHSVRVSRDGNGNRAVRL